MSTPRKTFTTTTGDMPAPAAAKIPTALTRFGELPDDAYVRLPVVCGLYACSPATAWRHARSGTIPAPRKISCKVTAWRVGDLRADLARRAA